MNATIAELFGVLGMIVVVAGISVAVVNGGNTANIIGASGKAFSDSITAATHPGK